MLDWSSNLRSYLSVVPLNELFARVSIPTALKKGRLYSVSRHAKEWVWIFIWGWRPSFINRTWSRFLDVCRNMDGHTRPYSTSWTSVSSPGTTVADITALLYSYSTTNRECSVLQCGPTSVTWRQLQNSFNRYERMGACHLPFFKRSILLPGPWWLVFFLLVLRCTVDRNKKFKQVT